MRFGFDPRKDAANRRKHGVPLSFGARIFDDANYLLIPTFREQDGEDRYKVVRCRRRALDGGSYHPRRRRALHFGEEEQ